MSEAQSSASSEVARTHQDHRGGLVRVGEFEVGAWGTMYALPPNLDEFDVIVTLNGKLIAIEDLYEDQDELFELELPDFGGVPSDWRDRLELFVLPRLLAGDTMLAYCSASHGRTGTFLASLIALLESEDDTPDPVLAVRQRHCGHAVETIAQVEGIFALRGQAVPSKYREEFASRPTPNNRKGHK